MIRGIEGINGRQSIDVVSNKFSEIITRRDRMDWISSISIESE
jgi:hypothetical protein